MIGTAAERTRRLPIFLIAEKADGKLSARPLEDGEHGPTTLERIRDRYARVWLAHAFMAASGAAQKEAVE